MGATIRQSDSGREYLRATISVTLEERKGWRFGEGRDWDTQFVFALTVSAKLGRRGRRSYGTRPVVEEDS